MREGNIFFFFSFWQGDVAGQKATRVNDARRFYRWRAVMIQDFFTDAAAGRRSRAGQWRERSA